MKTVTYGEILNRAAESAGRVRSQLPLAEAALMKSVAAMDLRTIWRAADWNELVPDPAEFTVLFTASNAPYISKNEGETNELGDIIGVWTANPRNYQAQPVELAFDEGDNVVRLRTPEPTAPAWPLFQQLPNSMPATVWVEYMLPCTDLNALSGDNLTNQTIPEKFAAYLAARMAAHLLLADGAQAKAGAQFRLAEDYLTGEAADITRPEWRWKLRVRK